MRSQGFLVFGLALGLLGLPPAQADAPKELRLTILHDNDLHGHLLPFAYVEAGKSLAEQPSRGGAARRATLIRQLKRQAKNPVLVIDSGDLATRGPLATTYEGLADVAAMNAVGYDLAAIGNNEFKLKDAADQNDAAGAQGALLQVVKRSKFSWLCANATDEKGACLEGVQPYIIREIHGVRVGFLGLTAPRSASYPQTKGWTITDPITAAQRWIPEARKHCDILIAVTHIGMGLDTLLAAQTTGLDAIVGGDSHTFLYQPLPVKNPAGVTVPIVQDGEFGADLGRFDLRFTHDGAGVWHLAAFQDRLIPIDGKIAEAPDVQAVLAPYVRPFQVKVGQLAAIAPTPERRLRQTSQILADALRSQSGADLALTEPGSGLFEVFRRPTVTRYDVYAALPFHDTVATASLTGAELTALLKSHPKALISGLLGPFAPEKSYRVAFVTYEARSGFGIDAAKLRDTGLDVRQTVISFLAKSGKPLRPGEP